MTSRRAFLTAALRATAAGVLVPEWLLDPLKGRSMVSVPGYSGVRCSLGLLEDIAAMRKIDELLGSTGLSSGMFVMSQRAFVALGGDMSTVDVRP